MTHHSRQMTQAQLKRAILAIRAADPDAEYVVTPYGVQVTRSIDRSALDDDAGPQPEPWDD